MQLNTQIRVPVELSLAGTPVIGVVPANILNGSVQVTRADGSTALVALTNGVNWFEIDSVRSPGLYHILLPSTAPSVLGPIQYSVVPAATLFNQQVVFSEVSQDSASVATILQFLIGNQKIDQTNSRLVILQSDGVTPLIQYYLTDENNQPSIYNIRNRSRVV